MNIIMDPGMKVICERILAKIKGFLHEKNIELEMNTEKLLKTNKNNRSKDKT